MLTTMLITHQSDVYRLPQVKSGNGNDIKRIFVAPHDSFLGHIINFIAPLTGRRSKSRGLCEALILVSRPQTMYCGVIHGVFHALCLLLVFVVIIWVCAPFYAKSIEWRYHFLASTWRCTITCGWTFAHVCQVNCMLTWLCISIYLGVDPK